MQINKQNDHKMDPCGTPTLFLLFRMWCTIGFKRLVFCDLQATYGNKKSIAFEWIMKSYKQTDRIKSKFVK